MLVRRFVVVVFAIVILAGVAGCKRGGKARGRGLLDPKPAMKTFRWDFELTAARDACPRGAAFAANKATIESKLGPADEEKSGGSLHWYGSGKGAGAKGSACGASCCELALHPEGASILAAAWSKCP